jgi:two-component system cell cycle sensor histidine kinase/response regulator CckA
VAWLKTNPENCGRIKTVSDPTSPVTLEEQLRACRAELAEQRTARERAEGALKESEGMFHTIVQALPMGVHLYHLESAGRLTFTGANAAADWILGIEHRALVGKPIEECFPALAGTGVPEQYRHVAATGESWHTEQIDYEDERIRGAFEVFAFRTAPGMMAALFLDIAERKRDEKALRESEEQYRLLVENAGDGIFIAQDGKVLFANRRAIQMAGLEHPGEAAGRSMLDFICPEDHALVLDRHARRLRGEDVPSTYALRMLRKDGTSFWTQLNAVAIDWKGRPASLNFIRDISGQRRFEEQLAAAERLRSIGTLAGGIAHDFNNILMGIQGNASLLLQSLGAASPLRTRLEDIERCVESGAELSARILGFAQGGQYNPVPTDLNGLVQASLQMFSRTRKEIAVHAACAGDLATVEIDRAQLEQVLLNLFVNAWQAMPGGGELFVETRNADVDDAQAAAAGIAPGRYVQVVVRDTGVGIDPAVRDRIFEPFFSTKDRGRGTGLGLASAYGIVRVHGGAIAVESVPAHGATFTITLPASGKPVVAPLLLPGDAVPGAGTVLLVDDESLVLNVGRDLLEHLGYAVRVAESGERAVELLRANRGRIDVVVLDMVMPGLSGGETFDRLREIDPGIRVLLSSGYSIDSQAREIIARGCEGFIQKPYDLKGLSRKLRAVIDGRAGR